jgi:H+-translocating NAD(P) transhydrogenase subunit alpha
MRVGVPAETHPDERRVALVPEVVARLVDAGLDVLVESGAGRHAFFSDEDYRAAGATVVGRAEATDPDVVVTVQPLSVQRAGTLRSGAITVSLLQPGADLDLVARLRDKGVTSFALDLVPRISRAQSMDALSSQALVSGYRAALVAADRLPKFFPLFMTAAGTVPPARVLVLGAGVAGLQAIATARRLGAVVTAFDIRSAVKEQIQSLGAKFFEVEGIGDAEAAGGYARELTPEEQQIQREALSVQMGRSDAIITTALVPGRPAPKLIPADAVHNMKPGSVIVDLAAEAGGNCELAKPGETYTTENGVRVAAPLNLPSQMAEHASSLYARNILSLIELGFDFEDEVVKGACVVREGEVV